MNADTRAAIAEALDAVDGIQGFRRRPNACKPGDAWPQWSGGNRDDDSPGFLETWRVMVVTDQGTADAADAFLDQYGEALLDALAPVLFVDSYLPAKLDTTGGDLYALMITGRTE